MLARLKRRLKTWVGRLTGSGPIRVLEGTEVGHEVDILPLVCPLRYDIVVKRDFCLYCEAAGDDEDRRSRMARLVTRLSRVLALQPLKAPVRRAIEAFRRATAGWRVLPDFINIGAQKAGTTALYSYLLGHPSILPAWRKEVLFFTHHYTEGLGWYRAQFPLRVTMDRLRRRKGCAITGEASPYYLSHPDAPRRVREAIPGARLIALLRDPVSRSISQYYHEKKWGYETLPIEEAFAAEPERIAGEADRLLADSGYVSLAYQRYSYTTRSLYLPQIKAWHAYFPREQILVLRAEDLFNEPQRTFRIVFAFLGLPPLEPKEFPNLNPGRYFDSNEALRKRLREFFEPHNRALYEYLGVDWRWEA